MDDALYITLYSAEDSPYDPCAELGLPATEYEIQDSFQKAISWDGDKVSMNIDSYGRFGFLKSCLDEVNDVYALNALAKKLISLSDWQVDALEGLVTMDRRAKAKIDLPRLYDLASSVDSCLVLYDVTDYDSIGRFYVENDMLPELEEMSDEALKLLNYDEIGKRIEAQGDGTLIGRRGYVALIGDIHEEYKELDLTPREPDYTALLEVTGAESGQSALLKLPCDRAAIDDVRTQLGADDLSVLSWRCVDCLVPALRDAFSQEDNIGYANHAAKQLKDLPKKDLLAYKALIGATLCPDLPSAMKLMGDMSSYDFVRAYRSPEAVALGELKYLLEDYDRSILRPCVNLHKYGELLIEEQNISMTPYGSIERKDGEPIKSMRQEPQMGGMSMM